MDRKIKKDYHSNTSVYVSETSRMSKLWGHTKTGNLQLVYVKHNKE